MPIESQFIALLVAATLALLSIVLSWAAVFMFRNLRPQVEQHAEATLAVFLVFLPMRQFWVAVILLTMVVAMTTLLLSQNGYWMLVSIGFTIAVLPLLRNVLYKQRIQNIETQLPEALRLLANSLQAGMSLPSGLALTAQQVQPPLATELALIVQRHRTGESLAAAFSDFQRRASTSIVQFFTFVILMSVRHGGQQADLLTRMADAIQQQHYARQRILSLSAQARLQGRVMFFLPLGLFLALKAVHQDTANTLLATSAGHLVLLVCGCLMGAGYFLTKRILGQFDVAD